MDCVVCGRTDCPVHEQCVVVRCDSCGKSLVFEGYEGLHRPFCDAGKATRIRVRVVVEMKIDSAAYVAAGIEAECYDQGDVDPQSMPRWARDTMRVISQTTEVVS